MSRTVLLAFLLFTESALACQGVSPAVAAEQRRAEYKDQRDIIKSLAVEAEAIYVATALNATFEDNQPEFRIESVLKGKLPVGTRVTFEAPMEYTIGCSPSSGFRNISTRTGQKYLVYVVQGRLLRAGEVEREGRTISWSDEIKLVQRTLKT